MSNLDTAFFPNADALASTTAGLWLDQFAASNPSGKPYCVALSGGRVAQSFFSAVVIAARARSCSFTTIQFFWADERCVPPADRESNFRVAREHLFAPLRIPEEQIHRIAAEKTPSVAAVEAAAELCQIAPLDSEGQPVLDLVLLGMGEDGHVASLFPGESHGVMTSPAVYREVTAAKLPPRRVTMGYKTIEAARAVWVLASGLGKGPALRESLRPGGLTPLARVIQSRPLTRIFADFYPT